MLLLHTAAELRIATAHGLTQPVHMLRGIRQGYPESPLLYALLLEPLLRAQGYRLRQPGEAKRGLFRAYIGDLLVVAHTLQHFVEGLEAVAVYLGGIGLELKSRKCAMATTEGVPGLHLAPCPDLEKPWHCVLAADSVPYLGLELQPDVDDVPLVPQHPRPGQSGAGHHPRDPGGADQVLKRYPEPHDQGGVYNRSPCAH